MTCIRTSRRLLVLALMIAGCGMAFGQNKTTLYNFTNGNDGAWPFAGVTMGAGGTLFGTASYGGDEGCSGGGAYCGTVFELTPSNGNWIENTIYTFGENSQDASTPDTELVFDGFGNLYGATSFPNLMYQLVPGADGTWTTNWPYFGGTPFSPIVDKANNLYNSYPEADGNGAIFELSPNSDGTFTQTVLYSFAGGADGAFPSGIVMDSAGRIYGGTTEGGDMSCEPPFGCGTIFVLLPPSQQGAPWTHQVLYSFPGGAQGTAPYFSMARDQKGNLYGISSDASCSGTVCSLIFELSPPAKQNGAWTISTIHTFVGGNNDGDYAQGAIVLDSLGQVYGTTQWGGGGPCVQEGSLVGCGTVYRFAPPAKSGGAWKETLLHRFQSGSDGAYPKGRVLLDEKHKVLYGTTSFGGNYFSGTVFQITP